MGAPDVFSFAHCALQPLYNDGPWSRGKIKGMEATPEQKKSLRRTKIAIWIILVVCVVLLVTNYVLSSPPPPHKYDAFAQCIANTSTTFFGAFWCPHCAQQKTMLGTGAQYLPYHECSTPDGKGELQSCIDAGVSRYVGLRGEPCRV